MSIINANIFFLPVFTGNPDTELIICERGEALPQTRHGLMIRAIPIFGRKNSYGRLGRGYFLDPVGAIGRVEDFIRGRS